VDFAPGETEQAVARLAADVLDRGLSPASPPGRRDGDQWEEPQPEGTQWDKTLWKELAQAGLLALALPPGLDGDGLGVMATAAVLTEVGRRAAPVPALATLALGVLPVIRHGHHDLQSELLAGVAGGDTVLTAAVREPSAVMPRVPATVATLGDGPGAVSGVKVGVPYAASAAWILVPASIAAGGTGVVVVDPAAGGVSLTPSFGSGAVPEYTLRLDGAPVRHVLGGPDGRAVADLYRLAVAGACCVADGALAAGLALTTAHVRSREQFGRPLAAFQAVAQRIADIYIAARTLHLATLSACWRLETGRDADGDLDVAAYWLADQAPAALRSCHHLHGGLGMDVSYPLHRYTSLVRDLVRFVGGTEYRLDRLSATVCG
jgi:alkylation response protein AidB-like acyl-CoA dehydrogenase